LSLFLVDDRFEIFPVEFVVVIAGSGEQTAMAPTNFSGAIEIFRLK